MLSRLGTYLRQHHLALIALFLALGGTSMAATKILVPRNSVGTPQLKKGAVTKDKIAKSTLARLKGNRGAAGAPGPAGPAGPRGARGIQGLPGPTSGAIAGAPDSAGAAGFSQYASSTTLTLPTAGKVVVALNGWYYVLCTAAGTCGVLIQAFLDGTPVPGAWNAVYSKTSASNSQYFSATGLLANVAAGTHTLTVMTKYTGFVSVTNSENVHATGVALGNG